MNNIFLEGKQVYLRAPELNDALFLAKIDNLPAIRKFMINRYPISVFKKEEYIEKLNDENNIFLIIFLKKDNLSMGYIKLSISWINRRGMLTIAIDPNYQHAGYGKETMKLFLDYAFFELNLHKIVLEVYEFNEGAIIFYKKLGFEIEGRFKNHSFKNGKYVNLIFMGLLREKWEEKRY